MSKAIGKYMENSGLIKRLSDCGIYSPLAVQWLDTDSEYKEKERDNFGLILNKIQTGLEDVPTCHNQLIEELTSANLFSQFREDLQKQGKFINKLSWK